MKGKSTRKASEKEVLIIITAFMCLAIYGAWTMKDSAQSRFAITTQMLSQEKQEFQNKDNELKRMKRIMMLTDNKGIEAIKPELIIEYSPLLHEFNTSTSVGSSGAGSQSNVIFLTWKNKDNEIAPQDIFDVVSFIKALFGSNEVALVQTKPVIIAVSVK